MFIGIDSFSYHRFFGEISPYEPDTDVRWQTADFLRRACELGVDAVSLQTAFLDANGVDSLRQQFEGCNLKPVLAWGHPDGLNGGTDVTAVDDFRAALFVAGALGCSLVRFVTGHSHSFKQPVAERIERLTPIIKSAAEAAAALDLTLAIENHTDFKMGDLVTLVEEVRAPNLGICFDGVNAVRVGDDLIEAARLAAPYLRMVHIRDWLPHPGSPNGVEGFWPSVPLGYGRLDIDALIGFLEISAYTGGLFVEIAYMHPDYVDEDKAVAESVAYLKRRLAHEQQGITQR